MNWRQSVSIGLLLLAGCGAGADESLDYFPNVGVYEASTAQARVDRSFSDILIITPLDQVRSRLTEIPFDGCEEHGECAWRDAEGVRHYLWADEPFAYFVVVKSIHADEFEGRPVPALRIGLARRRSEVMAAARKFVPEADFECSKFAEDGTEVCNATLHPGWVTIRFNASGSLTEVRLDGYHFT
jgi:hypothetical protein